MEKYEKPEVNIILVTDIIRTSGDVNENPPQCQGGYHSDTNN